MIKSAAVRKDNKIYTGRRHNDAIRAAILDGADYIYQDEQGFVTDAGDFVDREAAARIAFECGQIKKPKNMLYSEDLF